VDFDWNVLVRFWPAFLRATLVTYGVAVLAMLLALVLGLVLALMKLSRHKLFSVPAQVYIEIFRAVPLYVFLLWTYYGLRVTLDIGLAAVPTAVLSLGLITAAYMAEIYRGGFIAVRRGQQEAGLSVGLSPWQVLRYITLPQVTRVILPATVNQFVGVMKGATIAGVIGVFDLMYFARTQVALNFQPFEYYTIAGLILIASTLVVAGVATIIERRFRWRVV
jgi:His/Glu/Gln/Arg/opine family amino acid ABC transporter permease subunit